jgi:hypothetical protein
MASIYQRGKVLSGKWSQDGRVIRQSLGTRDKAEAKRVLNERMNQMVTSKRPTTSKVTWNIAAADLLTYYRAYGTRNPVEAGYKIEHLTTYFMGMPLDSMDSQAIAGYVVHRRGQSMAAGSVNVELATLRRALRLAHEHGKLEKVPTIRMLRPAAPRAGFFEREQFEAVAQALPSDLALVVRVAHTYGWRLRSEVLTLARSVGPRSWNVAHRAW